MRDTKEKLSTLTIALHWTVGLSVIALAIVGVYMTENKAFELYPIHKSIGVMLFAFIIARVCWRFKNGWLLPVSDYKAIEHSLARIIHWVLIIAIIVMPISGFIMSGAGGSGVSVFGLEIIAAQFDPIAKQFIPHNASVAGFMHEVHGISGWTMIFVIVLHLMAALKHHFIDNDNALKRMLGRK